LAKIPPALFLLVTGCSETEHADMRPPSFDVRSFEIGGVTVPNLDKLKAKRVVIFLHSGTRGGVDVETLTESFFDGISPIVVDRRSASLND
jgi:hypothetical protein